ncbi:hypothetical protein C0W54_09640 [Photobacterium kishitanii]|uniref:hypothetical protein n=1 Tax=Photobacterium kishitanii TaxID=318456 RepID=UPI000D15BBF9|nr:hypothetical protein [Photobacterium kishitanii]PSW62085.1 hypothetical protein C0W54_09640 [Photobacterium kishitanii]
MRKTILDNNDINKMASSVAFMIKRAIDPEYIECNRPDAMDHYLGKDSTLKYSITHKGETKDLNISLEMLVTTEKKEISNFISYDIGTIFNIEELTTCK